MHPKLFGMTVAKVVTTGIGINYCDFTSLDSWLLDLDSIYSFLLKLNTVTSALEPSRIGTPLVPIPLETYK